MKINDLNVARLMSKMLYMEIERELYLLDLKCYVTDNLRLASDVKYRRNKSVYLETTCPTLYTRGAD